MKYDEFQRWIHEDLFVSPIGTVVKEFVKPKDNGGIETYTVSKSH